MNPHSHIITFFTSHTSVHRHLQFTIVLTLTMSLLLSPSFLSTYQLTDYASTDIILASLSSPLCATTSASSTQRIKSPTSGSRGRYVSSLSLAPLLFITFIPIPSYLITLSCSLFAFTARLRHQIQPIHARGLHRLRRPRRL